MDEAISAVADEGFLGDEDDDYEDLYNDVNVGENFMQSMRKTDDPGFRNDVVEEKRTEQPPMVPGVPPSGSAGFSAPGVVDGAANTGGAGGPADPRALAFQNQGFRGNEVKAQGPVGSSPLMGGGSGGMRVELAQRPSKPNEIEEQTLNNSVPGGPQGLGQQLNGSSLSAVGNIGNEGLATQGTIRNMSAIGVNGAQNTGSNSNVVAVAGPGVGGNFGGSGGGTGGGGGTMLFVGDLHWWTTDGDLEAELCKYGQVKEVKFFDEKASGKSKGYCQVEFFDASAATACKEGMNGHLFNGRACVVAFATPFTIKRMGEAQVNRSQPATQSTGPQARRGPNDMVAKTGGNNMAAGGDFQGVENRGFGRGNWGRGNMQGMGNRGAVGGPMRNRGGMGGRGLMGNGGHGFGQGMAGGPPMMHPQAMMGQGFDPAFGGHMGRMGGYGGFPGAPGPPFGGLMPSFPPGGVGLPGVAPHVNPAIFGRGMPMNGMGMMPTAGMEGPNMGMWSDPNMGGWGGEEPGGRAAESSYGEEAASEHQYPEANQDRGAWQNSSKEKERGSERDWSGSSDRRYPDDRDVTREKDTNHDREWSERRHRDERDSGRERSRDHERERERSRDRERDRERERDRDRDRERYREDREKHSGHYRHRDHESEHADDYERGRSSRTHSKSRVSQEDDHRSRSRDADYGKRRRES